jgi:Toxin SymE, type I toxin-antitoxin system
MHDFNPKEYKVIALRDYPMPERMQIERNVVETIQSPRRIELSHTRTLKIESTGDFWKGHMKPKIRLMGRWLEQAGFKPGNHVHVTCVSPGVIELRSPDI